MAVLFASVIIVRIYHLQVTQGDKWRKIARENSLKFIEVQATRGNILNDNGGLLATSLPFYKVAFDPTVASNEIFDKGIDSLSVLLAEYFQEKEATRYAAEMKLARDKNRKYILISRKEVKYYDKKMMVKWPVFKDGRMKGGVIFEKKEKRFKPFEPLARRTIGFFSKDTANNITGRGLEYSFNKLLAGTNGKALYQRISGGRWKLLNSDSQIRPENGLDIQTTIDIELQEHSTMVLRNALYENKANYGCVIVMEVRTGEIKTIVNLGKVKNNKYIENYNYAVGNQGVVEPGSTFKLASIMALLEESDIDIQDTINTERGEYTFYDDCIMKDAAYYGYGKISIQAAFEKSSNIGISKLIFKHFKRKTKQVY